MEQHLHVASGHGGTVNKKGSTYLCTWMASVPKGTTWGKKHEGQTITGIAGDGIPCLCECRALRASIAKQDVGARRMWQRLNNYNCCGSTYDRSELGQCIQSRPQCDHVLRSHAARESPSVAEESVGNPTHQRKYGCNDTPSS
jgi:hypothetical protein